VVFVRTDLPDAPSVPALIDFADESTPRRTTLVNGSARVETVEHVLSALAGLGIDNAVVELDAVEPPGGDGSAELFAGAIADAGIERQDAERRVFTVERTIAVEQGGASLTALPSEAGQLELFYALDYGTGGAIPPHAASARLDGGVLDDRYARTIAPARTFSTRAEAEAAREAGMFAHLSPADVLVIDQGEPIDNAYRFADEPARHKLLDLVGDLALAGVALRGRFIADRSGHELNREMARRLRSLASHGFDAALPPPAPDPDAAPAYDVRRIMDILPHRYPMILVDRVVELGGRHAIGVKNVTLNEPFFPGHYPMKPIMPGVLIVEAMGQLGALMLADRMDVEGKVGILLSIDGVKLRRAVGPGDQLVLRTEAMKFTKRMADVRCEAFVGRALVAEARVKFLLAPPE
jgi:UDP-3-O-[3-hydroxymyristoyl] N-acetylglucosamine deacetylase/3-hydroxyacyl-[acyl-carrier-protein] dehydratase